MPISPPPFDPEPARRGVDNLARSLAQWSEFLDAHPHLPLSSEEVATELRMQANRHAIEVVRWIRAVDDYLAGRGTDREPLSGYTSARAADIADTGSLLNGLRYAANKSLHLLVDVLDGPPPVDLFARGFLGGTPPEENLHRLAIPRYRWPRLNLPLRGDQQSKDAYAAHLAGGVVDDALVRAAGWLRGHIE